MASDTEMADNNGETGLFDLGAQGDPPTHRESSGKARKGRRRSWFFLDSEEEERSDAMASEDRASIAYQAVRHRMQEELREEEETLRRAEEEKRDRESVHDDVHEEVKGCVRVHDNVHEEAKECWAEEGETRKGGEVVRSAVPPPFPVRRPLRPNARHTRKEHHQRHRGNLAIALLRRVGLAQPPPWQGRAVERQLTQRGRRLGTRTRRDADEKQRDANGRQQRSERLALGGPEGSLHAPDAGGMNLEDNSLAPPQQESRDMGREASEMGPQGSEAIDDQHRGEGEWPSDERWPSGD